MARFGEWQDNHHQGSFTQSSARSQKQLHQTGFCGTILEVEPQQSVALGDGGEDELPVNRKNSEVNQTRVGERKEV